MNSKIPQCNSGRKIFFQIGQEFEKIWQSGRNEKYQLEKVRINKPRKCYVKQWAIEK